MLTISVFKGNFNAFHAHHRQQELTTPKSIRRKKRDKPKRFLHVFVFEDRQISQVRDGISSKFKPQFKIAGHEISFRWMLGYINTKQLERS